MMVAAVGAPALLLLLAAGGAGLLVRGASATSGGRAVAGTGATLLAGFGLAAALASNLFLLGIPRVGVLGLVYALAVAGWVRAVPRWRTLLMPRPWPLAAGLVLAAALAAPSVLAFTQPLLAHDAVVIWWPKVEEVARGAWPQLADPDPVHGHPEYPRGLAWLVSLACPWGAPDPRLVRVVPLLMTFLAALAMAGTGPRVGGCTAFAGALAFLLLPDVAQWSHSGHADLPLAAMVLLAGFGLSERDRPRGALLAAVAAIGAASIKEEGAIVVVAVALALFVEIVRRPATRAATAAALAVLLAVAPWWRLRAAAGGGVLATASNIVGAPELLLLRVVEVARDVLVFFFDPASLVQAGEEVAWMPLPWAPWVVLVSVLVLLPRGPRPIAAFPALLLLLADLAVYIVTPSDVRWHVRTSFGRLLIQVLPLLLLAAVGRLVSPRPVATGEPVLVAGPPPEGETPPALSPQAASQSVTGRLRNSSNGTPS